MSEGSNNGDLKLTLFQRARQKIYANNPELVRELFPRNDEWVIKNPHHARGQRAPSSPLIDLLMHVEKSDRGMIWNVRLDKSLGYNIEREFITANELLGYLTQQPGASEAEKQRDTAFKRVLTLEDLLIHSRKYPGIIRLKDREAKISRIGNHTEVKYRPRRRAPRRPKAAEQQSAPKHGEPSVDHMLLVDLHSNKYLAAPLPRNYTKTK